MFPHKQTYKVSWNDAEHRLLYFEGAPKEQQKPKAQPEAQKDPESLESRMEAARKKYAELKKYADRHQQYPNQEVRSNPILSAWQRIQDSMDVAKISKNETTKNTIIVTAIEQACRNASWPEVHRGTLRGESEAQCQYPVPTQWKELKGHVLFWIDAINAHNEQTLVNLLHTEERNRDGFAILTNMMKQIGSVRKNIQAIPRDQIDEKERKSFDVALENAEQKLAQAQVWYLEVRHQLRERQKEQNEKKP